MSYPNILDVKFFVKKGRIQENYVPLYARIEFGGMKTDVSLKRDIELDKWSPKIGRAIGKPADARAFNNYLEQVRTDIFNCLSNLKARYSDNGIITAEAIKSEFCGVDLPHSHSSLMSVVDYHNNHLKSTIEPGTMKNYYSTRKFLLEFLKKQYNAADIPLRRLKYGFLVDLQIFLRERKPDPGQRPCGHNTALKHIERLRKIINIASKNEWIEKDPFVKFKDRFLRKDRVFLNQQEIDSLERTDLQLERHRHARPA